MARGSRMGAHLVNDHEDAVLVAQLADGGQVAGRGRQEAALPHDGLDDHRRCLPRRHGRGVRLTGRAATGNASAANRAWPHRGQAMGLAAAVTPHQEAAAHVRRMSDIRAECTGDCGLQADLTAPGRPAVMRVRACRGQHLGGGAVRFEHPLQLLQGPVAALALLVAVKRRHVGFQLRGGRPHRWSSLRIYI